MKEFIVISDLHCGSRFAITPTPKNNVQCALRKIWREMLDDLSTRNLTAGICLGDCCEGPDKKGMGEYNDTNNILEQVDLATSLLSEIQVKNWYGVEGSPYHTGQNVSSDSLVMRGIGGDSKEERVVNVDGKRIHCSHSVGVSMASPAYRTTPIAREMMLATLNEKEYGKFDVILRGHAHYFVRVQFGGSSGVICPCWKGRDAFAARRTLSFMPHLGYVLLKIENKNVLIEPHIFSLKGENLINEDKV